MDIGQELLSAVSRLFQDRITPDVIRNAEAGVFPHTLWSELMDLGVGEALVPVDRGGHGLMWSEIAPMLRATGAAPLPCPLGEHVVATGVLETAKLACRTVSAPYQPGGGRRLHCKTGNSREHWNRSFGPTPQISLCSSSIRMDAR